MIEITGQKREDAGRLHNHCGEMFGPKNQDKWREETGNQLESAEPQKDGIRFWSLESQTRGC